MIRPCPARVPLLLGFLLAATAPHAFADGDEAAVRDVVRKYVEAREARDPAAIEALFTQDADQLVSDGTWRKGREVLVKGMLESSRRNAAKRTIAVEAVRFLAADVALVDGRYRQEGQAGAPDRVMWTTITLRRDGAAWRIAAIRNMLPAPPS
ncbi:SgcJ/EcaC family oxidoreductase [Tundrisphaera sp. TA3]|uniref:SgcJ/EcaC family oxidoreductase n=1 Tax=Tundrisphaera sp. TA3 TaxID=3435775 RepID=UPI003EBB98D0